MQLAPAKLRTLIHALGAEHLSSEDAATIVGIARLAVDADAQEDQEELAAYDVVAAAVCELGGIDVEGTERREALKWRGPDDRAQRMQSYAHALGTPNAKELAYACANLVTIADLAIQPAESEFLAELQAALDIDDAREQVVAQLVNDAIEVD